jgi:hypothetical protein
VGQDYFQSNPAVQLCEAMMNSKSTIGPVLVCVLGLATIGLSPACAQNALGGAKTQQNKLGGVAKPAPAIGGATKMVSPPSPPKPGPVIGMTKPNSPGTPAPGSTGNAMGQTAGTPTSNPPVTAANKGGQVGASSLKCANGACTSRGAPKP